MFIPLTPFKGKGSISFINEKLGEIWYELLLEAEREKPKKIERITSELGKRSKQIVTLNNPSRKKAEIKYNISNP